jgi:hypothetical protein
MRSAVVTTFRRGRSPLVASRAFQRHCQSNAASRPRSIVAEHLNPWPGLAAAAPEVLAVRVESYSTTFGIVSALMCGVSAAGLATTPIHSDDAVGTPDGRAKGVHAKSLLVDCGVSPLALEDLYVASCALSMYSGMCGLGLSTVALAWNAVTPPCGAAAFVRRHSVMLCAIPFFTAVAVGLSGFAVFVGIDMTRGRPLSHIGLVGTGLTGAMVLVATRRGMVGAHKAIASAAARRRQ